jgi:hypothetical protein
MTHDCSGFREYPVILSNIGGDNVMGIVEYDSARWLKMVISKSGNMPFWEGTFQFVSYYASQSQEGLFYLQWYLHDAKLPAKLRPDWEYHEITTTTPKNSINFHWPNNSPTSNSHMKTINNSEKPN